jgi:hypothetical protein
MSPRLACCTRREAPAKSEFANAMQLEIFYTIVRLNFEADFLQVPMYLWSMELKDTSAPVCDFTSTSKRLSKVKLTPH